MRHFAPPLARGRKAVLGLQQRGTHSFFGLRIPIVALAFIAVLAIAIGGQWLFYRTQVAVPLETGFEKIPGVAGVTLEKAGSRTDLFVHLTPSADLAETYRLLESIGQKVLGSDLGAVHIVDDRTPELTAAYHRLHFAVQEGAATGRFVEMAGRVDRLAVQTGLDEHRLVVGDRYLFVQLRSGSHWLYAVVPRPEAAAAGLEPELRPGGEPAIEPGGRAL